jgi:hypothetical protein
MEFKQKRARKLADSRAQAAGVAMVADAQSALTPFGTYQYGGSPLQAKSHLPPRQCAWQIRGDW